MPPAGKIKSMLGSIKGATMNNKGALALGLLSGIAAKRTLMPTEQPNPGAIQQRIDDAVNQSQSEKIAKLLEQARMERSIQKNQMQLARQTPDLYTSVMAGRRVPKGSVVLGGRPRQDLMRELAASMDSGRYAPKDPLSDLMG
jgi:hypothetical protein